MKNILQKGNREETKIQTILSASYNMGEEVVTDKEVGWAIEILKSKKAAGSDDVVVIWRKEAQESPISYVC